MSPVKLSIAEPCHENWNTMLPEEKGRFCLSCQKTVIDFTTMSDRQVFDYFKNYNGNTCGQFTPDQLDRELTKPKTSGIGRWKYFWQILLPAVFAFHKLEAQPKLRGKVTPTTVCTPDNEKSPKVIMGKITPKQAVQKAIYQIQGKIIDTNKEPVPFATITSSDEKYVVADSSGKFKISLSEKASLTISQVGYTEGRFTIDSLQTNHISGLKIENGLVLIETTIELKPSETKMPDVVVTGNVLEKQLTVVKGELSVVTSKMPFTKQKLVNPNKHLPQLSIFPNPIQPGQNFQVTFQVNKTGNYFLKIVDAAGRVMVDTKVNVVSKNQTESIRGECLQKAGIYFLTLTNPSDKKGKPLNGRVVVR